MLVQPGVGDDRRIPHPRIAMTCAHEPCNCTEMHVTGQAGEYCSADCQDRALRKDASCACEHDGCAEA